MQIAPLEANDRAQWGHLARGYREFYKTATTEKEFDHAWRRLLEQDVVLGLGAKVNGQLVGIAHYLFHASTWAPKVCYLQDLFTSPEARGNGVARALIEAVAQKAQASGAARYYWLTQEENQVARHLYDKVAKYNGFIRYDFAIPQPGA